MWRAAFVLVTALALAGCGAAENAGGPTSTSGVDTGGMSPSEEAERTRHPLVLLRSNAGLQEAVPGSSCAFYTDESTGHGVGSCGTSGPIAPDALSVVGPGEEITILVEESEVVHGGCQSSDEQSCIGKAHVKLLGCEESVAEIPLSLGPETRWTVDLAPGDYELDVFAYFAAPDGRSGDVTGSLGLRVDEVAPREIVPAPASVACPG